MNTRKLFSLLAAALALASCQPQTGNEEYPRIYKTDSSSEPADGETLASVKADQNAIYISAGILNATKCTVKKSGDGSSLVGGKNAAVLVTGTGWLVMKAGSVVSDAAFAPALAVTGGKAEGAVKTSGTILSTLGKDSPAIYMEANKIIMDEGQLSTEGDVPAIMVPSGSSARVELNGVLCSCPVLAQVGGTLYLKLGQYAASEIEYLGSVQFEEGGKLILDDPDNIWKGTSFGSGSIQEVL